MSKIVVHCKNKEEWDDVFPKVTGRNDCSYSSRKPYLDLNSKGSLRHRKSDIRGDWEIISAQEYLGDELKDPQQVMCEACRFRNDMSYSYLCEGRYCGDEENQPIKQNKGDNKMGKTIIDADIKAEFGKEDGNTLININDHIEDGVIRRVVMKKFHKEIVDMCNDMEKKRIEATKRMD